MIISLIIITIAVEVFGLRWCNKKVGISRIGRWTYEKLGGGFKHFLIFTPNLREIIFQMGWTDRNHQLYSQKSEGIVSTKPRFSSNITGRLLWVPREFLSVVLRSELPPELDGIEPTRNQVPNRGSWFETPVVPGMKVAGFVDLIGDSGGGCFWERDWVIGIWLESNVVAMYYDVIHIRDPMWSYASASRWLIGGWISKLLGREKRGNFGTRRIFRKNYLLQRDSHFLNFEET